MTAMNLSVDAKAKVYVKAAGVWHTLDARRITDHCVYFTPASVDDVTRIRCEMEQHVLASIRGILELLKVPNDETDAVLKKIKDQYDEHGGYDD